MLPNLFSYYLYSFLYVNVPTRCSTLSLKGFSQLQIIGHNRLKLIYSAKSVKMWLIISILQWTGLFLVLVLSGLYFWLTYPFDYFKKRGVPYAKGAIPFFGNAYLTSTGKKSHIFDIKEHYDYFKNER